MYFLAPYKTAAILWKEHVPQMEKVKLGHQLVVHYFFLEVFLHFTNSLLQCYCLLIACEHGFYEGEKKGKPFIRTGRPLWLSFIKDYKELNAN